MAQAGDAVRQGEPMREALKTGLTVLYVILLIPVLVALFFVSRFIYKIKAEKERTTIKEDHAAEAEKYAAEGEFLLAAKIYDTKLKEYNKAAVLYEKGGDYLRAAALYDVMRMAGKANEMYILGGDIKSAAEITFLAGEYEDASRLYYDAGMKKDAAMVFERADRKLAAVRIYREIGEFTRAAGLLEEEGLHKEAAEMFGFNLKDRELNGSSIDDFYKYALMLQEAGESKRSYSILNKIYMFDPEYSDVSERIQSLALDEEDESVKGKTTLKGFIRSGKLEPQHALKLWVQILRGLSGAHESGLPYGVISTDNILIDSGNNISFLNRKAASVYNPPEITKELELDVRSDIFSMGAVLYEMLTGKLEGLGSRRLTDIVDNVPEWLDEIVVRCIRKVREDRYRNIDEIFDHLKALSKEKD
jgi:tetratricopeptide (TPR) repeat protein